SRIVIWSSRWGDAVGTVTLLLVTPLLELSERCVGFISGFSTLLAEARFSSSIISDFGAMLGKGHALLESLFVRDGVLGIFVR
ncbi:20777_t:CDS:2, partial [Gigaspora rosea]